MRIFDRAHLNQAADRLRTFDRPALIAWSADDRVFPVADAKGLADDLPDARLALIEGARTFSMEDQPKRLAALIGEFIATTAPPHPRVAQPVPARRSS